MATLAICVLSNYNIPQEWSFWCFFKDIFFLQILKSAYYDYNTLPDELGQPIEGVIAVIFRIISLIMVHVATPPVISNGSPLVYMGEYWTNLQTTRTRSSYQIFASKVARVINFLCWAGVLERELVT